jgi:hypothetical protein
MIAVISYSEMAPDQFGDSQRGPEFRAVTVSHSPFQKQPNESLLPRGGQAGWSARCRLSFQCVRASRSGRVSPSHDTTGMAAYPTGNFMKGELLSEKLNCPAPPFFQSLRRTVRSHRDTPFQDVSTILHYLCGSQ